MFTGLIEDIGTVVASDTNAGGTRLKVRTGLGSDLAPGDSLAVNGVCLTVTSVDVEDVSADVGPETLRVTTLGRIVVGTMVNLERPLRADARLGGHLVQGHVDAVGRIDEFTADGDCRWLWVTYPPALSSYLVPKGSIAVDGISLTVASLNSDRFAVQVIPVTLERTNLGSARPGDPVNLECDIVGKYVVRAVEAAWMTPAARPANVLP
jgi:riboflavin synthase